MEEREFSQFVRDRFVESQSAYAKWREKAKESYEFYEGEQWTEEERQILRRQKRPDLTINRIFPAINAIEGYERQSRLGPKAFPVGAEDQSLAEVMTAALKFVYGQSKGEYQESDAFHEVLITGLGWLATFITTEKDPLGDPAFEWVPYDEVYPDPFFREPDGGDLRYVIRVKWMTLPEIKEHFPKADPGSFASLEAMASGLERPSSSGGDYDEALIDRAESYNRVTKRFMVREIWWHEPKRERVKVADDPETLEPVFVERVLSEVMMGTTVGDVVLIPPRVSPYNHGEIPYVPIAGFRGKRGWFGIVEQIKDPQREVNKMRSQTLNYLNRAPIGVWMAPKGFTDDVEKFANDLSTPGAVIEYESGLKPEQVQSASPPGALFQLEQYSAADIQIISGANNAVLGIPAGSREAVGAIERRQQQGALQHSTLFDNKRLSMLKVYRQIVALIQQGC